MLLDAVPNVVAVAVAGGVINIIPSHRLVRICYIESTVDDDRPVQVVLHRFGKVIFFL